MTVTNESFSLLTGDDKLLRFTISDSDGAALDVSLATAIDFLLKYDGGTITKSLGSGITIVSGKPEVTIDGGDTRTLTTQLAEYELDITLSGTRSTAARGTVALQESLSEPTS